LWALKSEPTDHRRDEPAPMHVRPVIAIPASPPPQPPAIVPDQQEPPTLTAREGEVLEMFAKGLSVTDIAGAWGLSYQCASTYRSRLLRKLRLTSTAGLIRYAIQHQADRLLPVPARPPMIMPPVVSPMMPAPMPITYRSRSVEREEWPG